MDPIEKELQRRLQKKGGKCQAFTLATLKQATTNFGKKLGVGGFGKCFMASCLMGKKLQLKLRQQVLTKAAKSSSMR
jgi:hypothetical protein